MAFLTFSGSAPEVVAPNYPEGGSYGNSEHPAFQLIGGDAGLILPKGFGIGDHYMLAGDENLELIYEPGPNTRVFYLTRGANGFTAAEIEAAESLSGGTVNVAWILAQNEYGFRSDMPLDFDEWEYGPSNTWADANPNQAPWVLHERGYDYSSLSGTKTARTQDSGFSALHPTRFGAWGSGERPVLASFNWGEGLGGPWTRTHWAFSEVEFVEVFNIVDNDLTNLMLDRCYLGFSTPDGDGFTPQAPGVSDVLDRITIYETMFKDIRRSVPANGTAWQAGLSPDRSSGIFADSIYGLLVMRSASDRNAWDPNYDPDSLDPADGGQPPTQYSHNFYFAETCQDTTILDVLSTRSAGSGFQLRSGHHGDGVLLIEDHIGNQIQGNPLGDPDEIYTLQQNFYYVGSGYRPTLAGDANYTGSFGWSLTGANQQDAVIKDCFVLNAVNPNDTAEIATKPTSPSFPLVEQQPETHLIDNLVIMNWYTLSDQNVPGTVSSADQDAATFSRWVDVQQAVAAGTNTTDDALDWIMAQAKPWDYIRSFENYIRGLLDQPLFDRTVAEAITFTPWIDAEGFRWDNRQNWTSRDRPGYDVEGDSAFLDGNTLTFFLPRCELVELHLGTAGGVQIYGGKLNADNFAGTGSIYVNRAGQFWTAGTSAGSKLVDVSSGRFGVRGSITNDLSVAVRGRGEVLVLSGAAFTVGSGHTLTIEGAEASVGFDGDDAGSASIIIASGGTLAFDVDGDSAFSIIDVFRSGFYGLDANGKPNEPSVTGSVVLASGSTVTVDSTGLSAGTYILAENVTDNGATLPSGVTVNGSDQLQLVVS